MCTPAGPSVSTVAGMPSRGIATVIPAAPGTSFFWWPIMAPEPTKASLPPPTSSWAFSSKVIAFNTSSILSARSLGDCAVIVVAVSMAVKARVNSRLVLISLLLVFRHVIVSRIMSLQIYAFSLTFPNFPPCFTEKNNGLPIWTAHFFNHIKISNIP